MSEAVGRRVAGRRVILILVLVAVIALLVPLGGPAPQHCTHDGDSGSCQTLLYRSPLTVGIAFLAWGGSNT